MNIKTMGKTGYTALASVLLAGTLIASPAPISPPTAAEVDVPAWNFQKEASDLLAQVQMFSDKLSIDSDTLASYSRSNLSSESHAFTLNLVRDDINQMGGRLSRLQQIKHVTAPWQQRAIEEVVPIAAQMAAHTQAAIEHLNDNQRYLFAPAYQDHIEAVAEHAATMDTILDKFMDLGQTEQKLQTLQLELEMES